MVLIMSNPIRLMENSILVIVVAIGVCIIARKKFERLVGKGKCDCFKQLQEFDNFFYDHPYIAEVGDFPMGLYHGIQPINAGESFIYECNRTTIYSLVEELQEWGIYLAEQCEE